MPERVVENYRANQPQLVELNVCMQSWRQSILPELLPRMNEGKSPQRSSIKGLTPWELGE